MRTPRFKLFSGAQVRLPVLDESPLPMRILSRTFQKIRVLVALALLLSVSAPLVQYACGVTGETHTTSTVAVEASGSDAAPCGVLSEGVHDRLCGSFSGCEGEACTTDTVETQSVVHSETSSLRIVPVLATGNLSSGEGASSGPIVSSRSGLGAEWTARDPNRISVRLRTLSFRL